MSNGIAKRQNNRSNIVRLAAQRQLYRDVNGIEVIAVVFTVIIPMAMSLLQDITGHGKTMACIVALIMLVLSFVLDSWQKEKKELAATIQQEFDINVYSMEWDRKLYSPRKNLNTEIAMASKKILGNAEEVAKLTNWYRIEVDSLPLEEGISACQKENFNWDAGLRKRYRIFLYMILIIVIGVELWIGIVKTEPIQEILLRLVTLSSALKWLIKTINGLNSDLKRMESIERAVYSTGKKSIEQLAFTQKDIFENRKVVTKIPDWFYNIFRNNDEDRERRSIEIQLLE